MGLAGAVAGLVVPGIWLPKRTEAAEIEIFRGDTKADPMDFYGDRPGHPVGRSAPDDIYVPDGSYDYGDVSRNVYVEETYLNFGYLENRTRTDQLVIHHIGNTNRDVSAAEVHQWHLNQGWSGIGYHFLIRKDGTVERGRPVDVLGSHVKGENYHTVGINIVGEFGSAVPTDAQIVSAAGLLADLCLMYRLQPSEYSIVGHRDLASTACPGNNLYDRLPIIRNMTAEALGG